MNLLRNTPEPEEGFWLPFTAMRAFHDAPVLFERAEGMHYITPEGRRVLDMMAGLWCVNAGHAHPRVTEALREAPACWILSPPSACRTRRPSPSRVGWWTLCR